MPVGRPGVPGAVTSSVTNPHLHQQAQWPLILAMKRVGRADTGGESEALQLGHRVHKASRSPPTQQHKIATGESRRSWVLLPHAKASEGELCPLR